MIDILGFVTLGALVIWRFHVKWSEKRSARRSDSELPHVPWPHLVAAVLLALSPLVWHIVAFTDFLEERGLSFFFDSLRLTQTWAFLRAGGFVYGLLEIVGLVLAYFVLLAGSTRPRPQTRTKTRPRELARGDS